ncbi:MAG: alpha/beta hydrolase-fold protein [Polyangiaceae bacterium]
MILSRSLLFAVVPLCLSLFACSSDDTTNASGGNSGSAGSGGSSGTSGAGGTAGSSGSSGSSGAAGSAGSVASDLDGILAELRANRDAALLAHSSVSGWPVPLSSGYLFVSTDLTLSKVAGDHDSWAGTDMAIDTTFAWVVIDVSAGDSYKFTDGTTYAADAWARSYTYDSFGEISLVKPTVSHLDRFVGVGDSNLEPRDLRVWVPEGGADRVLYVHDGQNLFDPNAPWGGWKLQDTVPAKMMLVGIDNTPARMDEYTHVTDDISGQTLGGKGDQYAALLKSTVRPLIQQHYGEPSKRGVMGSSLGGLISFHLADHDPGDFMFAASLSGTMGWGSIGTNVHNQTMIERYAAHGHGSTALYLDSGGTNGPCADTDNDGIEDDIDQGDNFCENAQMHQTLLDAGYVENVDVFYWFEDGGQHNEANWAARVFRPLGIFAGM